MKEYGPSARAILDEDLPKISKIALSEQIIRGCILEYKDIYAKAYSHNQNVKNFLLQKRGNIKN